MPGSGWLPAVLLLALPAAAVAQVYKCVDGSGASYQSQPCAAGQETARAWHPVAFAPPAAADLERTAGLQKASARRDVQLRGADRRSAGRPARAGARTPSAIGACEAARKKRDRELAAMGKAGRKIEIRRAADVQVASACR